MFDSNMFGKRKMIHLLFLYHNSFYFAVGVELNVDI